MPDTFTSGLNAFAKTYGAISQGKDRREARAQRGRQIDLQEEANERERMLFEQGQQALREQRDQSMLVASSDAKAQTDQAHRTMQSESSIDRLDRAVSRAGTGPFGAQMGALVAASMESMEIGAAGAYIEDVERKAAAMPSDAARTAYLDNTLYMFEREGAEREVRELRDRRQRLQDQGAFPEVASPTGGEGRAQGQASVNGGAPDPIQTLSGAIEALELGLQQGTTRDDFRAVRGGVRKAAQAIDQTVEFFAGQRARVAKSQALQARYAKLGQTLVDQGAVEQGLQYLEMASKVPGMNEDDISGALKGMSPFSGSDSIRPDQDQIPGVVESLSQGGAPDPVEQPQSPVVSPGNSEEVPRGTEGEQAPSGPTYEQAQAEAMRRARSRVGEATKAVQNSPDQETINQFGELAKLYSRSGSNTLRKLGRQLRSLLSADPEMKDPETAKALEKVLADVDTEVRGS